MRNARKRRNAQPPPIPLSDGSPGAFGGKAELAGAAVMGAVPPPSPSPSTMKLNGHSPAPYSISPVSAHSSAYPPPATPELQGHHPPMPQFNSHFPPPDRPELQGQTYKPNGALPAHHAELPGPYGHAAPPPNRPELYGQAYSAPTAPRPPHAYGGQPVHEFPGHHAVYQADSRPVPQRAELQGMTWQSGPVQHSYAELDGGYGRGMEPHAR